VLRFLIDRQKKKLENDSLALVKFIGWRIGCWCRRQEYTDALDVCITDNVAQKEKEAVIQIEIDRYRCNKNTENNDGASSAELAILVLLWLA
jgi:hypothetical protein